jgi:hypothetical protein
VAFHNFFLGAYFGLSNNGGKRRNLLKTNYFTSKNITLFFHIINIKNILCEIHHLLIFMKFTTIFFNDILHHSNYMNFMHDQCKENMKSTTFFILEEFYFGMI